MKLAFVDITYGYGADRPDSEEPLGGTTSAVCFTARALTEAGTICHLFNKTAQPTTAHNIPAFPLNHLAQACADPSYTAFMFCGRWMPDMVRVMRRQTKAKFIAWMHESQFNNQLVTALPEFDGVSFVSQWQQCVNQPHVLPHWKHVVIRNAMNPAVAHLFQDGEQILSNKTQPPIILYAGNAARGAVHVPPVLDELRKLRSDFSVQMFTNTNLSGHAGQDEKYVNWLRSLPNITHVGMVGQGDLAQHMKRASVFLSPNPWPETSCIAMIEAMAAGMAVITTNRAVLPETAHGFAQHIPVENADDPVRFDMPMPFDAFAKAVHETLMERENYPQATEQKMRAQVDYFLQNYQWRDRVEPWCDFLESF